MKNLVILILETISSVRWCLLASALGHLGVKGRRGNASTYRGTLALHRIQRKRVKYEEFYVDGKRKGDLVSSTAIAADSISPFEH